MLATHTAPAPLAIAVGSEPARTSLVRRPTLGSIRITRSAP